jgi:peptidoglycan hydrolase CwlO-like protein
MSTPITLEEFAKENETLVAQIAEKTASVETLTTQLATANDLVAKARELNAAADAKIVELIASLETTKASVEEQLARRIAEHGISKKAIETAQDQKPEQQSRQDQFAEYQRLLASNPVEASRFLALNGKNFLRLR